MCLDKVTKDHRLPADHAERQERAAIATRIPVFFNEVCFTCDADSGGMRGRRALRFCAANPGEQQVTVWDHRHKE